MHHPVYGPGGPNLVNRRFADVKTGTTAGRSQWRAVPKRPSTSNVQLYKRDTSRSRLIPQLDNRQEQDLRDQEAKAQKLAEAQADAQATVILKSFPHRMDLFHRPRAYIAWESLPILRKGGVLAASINVLHTRKKVLYRNLPVSDLDSLFASLKRALRHAVIFYAVSAGPFVALTLTRVNATWRTNQIQSRADLDRLFPRLEKVWVPICSKQQAEHIVGCKVVAFHELEQARQDEGIFQTFVACRVLGKKV